MTGPYTPGSWRARYRWLARVAYLLVLLSATLSPFHPDREWTHVLERVSRALHPQIAGSDVVDAARNLVLFAGWGVIWALTAAGSARRTILRATGTGFLVSGFVESAQLFSSDRNTSFLDLTTNTAGALGGALVLLVLLSIAEERRAGRSLIGLPALIFAGSYGTAAWLEAVIPLFRHDPVYGAQSWPTIRFAASLAAFRWASVGTIDPVDFLLFAPVGGLVVATLAEHGVGYAAAARRTMAAGVILSLAAELLHGCLGEPIVVGALLVHSVAVAAGAALAAGLLPRFVLGTAPGPRRARWFSASYAGILALWILRPLAPELSAGVIHAKLARHWYIPLASTTWQLDFFSVADVCVPFFLFLPLGALLASWPLRRTGWLAGPVPAVLLALAFEALQLVIRDRLPDITDVLVEAGGAIIGWAIVHRAAYPVYGETLPRTGSWPAFHR